MNRSNHTYCQSTLNAIFNGTFAGCTSTGKAQRECFAERYDFSATNATVWGEETGLGY